MKRVLSLAPTVWYVLANRAEAVFYLNGSDKKFHFIQRLKNKDGTKKEGNLVSDRGGSSASSADGSIRHSLQQQETHHEHISKQFAKEIADTLESARIDLKFDELVLVAEPRFLGLLRAGLSNESKKLIQHEVKKEYVRGSDVQLRASVLKAIKEERSYL